MSEVEELSLSEFLERGELYTEYKISNFSMSVLTETAQLADHGRYDRKEPEQALEELHPDKISIYCTTCQREQVHLDSNLAEAFNVDHGLSRGRWKIGVPKPVLYEELPDQKFRVYHADGAGIFRYECAKCETVVKFTVTHRGSKMRLIGKWPSEHPAPDEKVAQYLSKEEREFYKKALLCREHGVGIGASAYLRRIVENLIHRLLKDMREYGVAEDMEELDDDEIARRLKEGRGKEKCAAAKTVLPEDTTFGGHNPLQVLYGTLSGDLHANSDDEALDHADEIRLMLDYLIKRIETEREAREEYQKTLGKQSKEMGTD